jgi:hypothetical protein
MANSTDLSDIPQSLRPAVLGLCGVYFATQAIKADAAAKARASNVVLSIPARDLIREG